MATSDQSKCSTEESERIKHVCCSLCLDDGSRTAARHYCVDCELYYCGKCVKYHNKIPSSKSHQVNDVESPDSIDFEEAAKGDTYGEVNLTTETLRCPIHQGQVIDTYCKNHGEVCCGICAVIKHRLCATESIDEAAKDFKPTEEVNRSKEALSKVLSLLKYEREKRTENIKCISHQKMEQLIEAVDKREARIIEKVKALANTSRRDIRSIKVAQTTDLNNDVHALDAVITTTSAYVDKLELPDIDTNVFATVKSCDMLTRDGQRLFEDMVKEWSKEVIFHFDMRLENTLDGMKALGSCSIKDYKATLQKTINIQRQFAKQGSVSDMCFIHSGDLLLTDSCNLKRFDSKLLFKDQMRFEYSPVAVCTIDEHEVAVRLNHSVQFVSVGQSMKKTSSFKLDGDGYGMVYAANARELVVCERNTVSAYSKTGDKLRTFDKHTNGAKMFTACTWVALSMNKEVIYVTGNTGLTIFDIGGHLKMKVPLSGINAPRPICVLPGHVCLIVDQLSGAIVQVDRHGEQVGTLIEATNAPQGGTSRFCAAYDYEQSKLIVCEGQKKSVYTLHPQ